MLAASHEEKGGLKRGGNSNMRIAVPYENGQVFQHFGHTGQVEIYDDVHCDHHDHHGHCGEDKRGCAGNGDKCDG